MIPVEIVMPHFKLGWRHYNHIKLCETVHIYNTKAIHFYPPQIGFYTYIIQISHKMMCREVEDLRHGFGGFLLNEPNKPWVLSRLRLMINFGFGFALA